MIVLVRYLCKMPHFIPNQAAGSSAKVVELVIENIIKLHGLSNSRICLQLCKRLCYCDSHHSRWFTEKPWFTDIFNMGSLGIFTLESRKPHDIEFKAWTLWNWTLSSRIETLYRDLQNETDHLEVGCIKLWDCCDPTVLPMVYVVHLILKRTLQITLILWVPSSWEEFGKESCKRRCSVVRAISPMIGHVFLGSRAPSLLPHSEKYTMIRLHEGELFCLTPVSPGIR